MVVRREHQVSRNQHGQPKGKQAAVAHSVGELAERIGRQRVDQVHRHHHQRHQGNRHAALLGAQDQEGFAEASQREHPTDANDPPVGGGEAAQTLAVDRIRALVGLEMCRFTQAECQQRDTCQTGNDGYPEHRAEIVGPQQHQADGQQRAEEGADGVERLTQTERRPADVRRGQIGH
ncbi:hypothetical protein D3C80_1394450 [compost metagenome]